MVVGGGFHGEVEQRECDAARTVPNRRPCDFGLIRASVRTHSGARVRRDAQMLGKARERSIILRPVGSIVAKIGAGSLHIMLVKCTYPVLLGAHRHCGDILERVVMKKNSRQKWWPTAGWGGRRRRRFGHLRNYVVVLLVVVIRRCISYKANPWIISRSVTYSCPPSNTTRYASSPPLRVRFASMTFPWTALLFV